MPHQRKENKVTKEFLYTLCVGGFYSWNVYRITDAAHQVYYMVTPQGHGGTVLADKEEDIRPQLEKQVVILNDWLSKIK